jgi:hypothetical protein
LEGLKLIFFYQFLDFRGISHPGKLITDTFIKPGFQFANLPQGTDFADKRILVSKATSRGTAENRLRANGG